MNRGCARKAATAALCVLVALALFAATPMQAHQQRAQEQSRAGIAIPAITHGEMFVVARYRARILDLAERQPFTDPTLRRLQGFVSLQYFACFWGLIPGSLSDESSPFNECSHAYTAAARALLAHMVAMPGDQSRAKALEAQLQTDLANDPDSSLLCSNSTESFSGEIIWPDWRSVPTHLPTVLTIVALLVLALSTVMLVRRARRTRGEDVTTAGAPSRHFRA